MEPARSIRRDGSATRPRPAEDGETGCRIPVAAPPPIRCASPIHGDTTAETNSSGANRATAIHLYCLARFDLGEIEIHVDRSATIREITDSLHGRGHLDRRLPPDSWTVLLVRSGQVLQAATTLVECDIRPGDFLFWRTAGVPVDQAGGGAGRASDPCDRTDDQPRQQLRRVPQVSRSTTRGAARGHLVPGTISRGRDMGTP